MERMSWQVEWGYPEGKPSHPEASSLYVERLPALFAHAEEYLRP
jgi:hypothetical protein